MQLSPRVLDEHRRAHRLLVRWAPVAHQLVVERIAAMARAHTDRAQPSRADLAFAAQVLARGQFPFPDGVSSYDRAGGVRYVHVTVDSDPRTGEDRVAFDGTYLQPDGDGGVRTVRAHIWCPTSLVTDHDGIERYRAETVELTEAVRIDRRQLADA